MNTPSLPQIRREIKDICKSFRIIKPSYQVRFYEDAAGTIEYARLDIDECSNACFYGKTELESQLKPAKH